MIHEFQRSRAGTAFLAVDDDEIRRDPGGQHRLADRHELPRMANAELEPGRLAARQIPHPGDEFQEPDGSGKRRMPGRGHAVHPQRHATDQRNLLGHFCGRKDTAVAGFRPLRQLQLQHPHLRFGGGIREPDRIETAVRRPRAEIAGAEFPDQIAAVLAVVGRNAAFAGIVVEAAKPGPLVQGPDRIGG